MAIAATFVASNQFSVAADRVSLYAAGRRVKANCGADGYQKGTVASTAGTTVTLAMDSGAALTANLTAVSHGALTTEALPWHGHKGPADGGNIFATLAQAVAGTDNATAMTPAAVAAAILAAIGIDPDKLPRAGDLGTAAWIDQTWLYKTAYWDAPSISAGSVVSQDFAVPGVEAGDWVGVAANFPLGGNLFLWAEAKTSDVVAVYLRNFNTVSVDLSNATYYITVLKRVPAR